MTNTTNIIRLTVLLLILLAAQILIFNNIQISGFVNPYIYVLFILSLPFGTTTAVAMVLGFIVGLVIDIFCNTIGMHAAACVAMAYARGHVLRLMAQREEYKFDNLPTARSYGKRWYLIYSLSLVAVHHIVLFFAEQFDTLFFGPTLLRLLLSIVATMILVYLIQFLLPIEGSKESD